MTPATMFEAVKAEAPILFQDAMVVEILNDSKSETRRLRGLAEVNRLAKEFPFPNFYLGHVSHSAGTAVFHWQPPDEGVQDLKVECPYGGRGTKLWVREAHNTDWDPSRTIYRAGGGSAKSAGYSSEPRWKPSIHMFRKDSRITLEVTGISVERLQEITQAGAAAEGCHMVDMAKRNNLNLVTHGEMPADGFIGVYRKLWDSINFKAGLGWDVNPYVWVVKFKKVKL